jgi:esterase/lipase superfamily enzyme
MSFFPGNFPARHFAVRKSIAVLCLSALLPVAAALSGCSEAPKIQGAPKSEASKSDGPTAGAPAPGDAAPSNEETASGSTGEPPAPAEAEKPAYGGIGSPAPQQDGSNQSIGSRPPENDVDVQARSAGSGASQRESETDARWKDQQRDAARMREMQSDPYSSAARQPKKAEPPPVASAQPPPPPAPAPSAPSAPAPSAQPSGGATDDGVTSRDRGLGTAAKPPAALDEKPKAFDVVPIFYGTDRTVEPDPKRLQFGTERGHKLQLGRALVTVPTAHKVPSIERPWVVELPYFKYKIYEETEDPAKHFTMQEIAALTKEQMLIYVKQRLAGSKTFKDHAFVFVHGFNTSFDAAIYRTAQIAYDLKFDGAPFVYSWPSGGKVASYTYDRGSAEQAEPQLTEFLDIVIKESGAKSISLIAHSMGNELLLRVMERMKPALPKGVVISQVILAAPDVDRDKFTNIAREITNFAKGVTLYAASNDRALGYSARFWGGVPRAGDVPASGPLIIPGVDTIDVTAVSTDSLGLNHSGYAENKTLLNDIALLLQSGERPPDKREPTLQKIDSSAGSFWRYPPGAH